MCVAPSAPPLKTPLCVPTRGRARERSATMGWASQARARGRVQCAKLERVGACSVGVGVQCQLGD
eukprot:scaffold281962_cov48-Tisochrysis_lutea.AAC.1